MNPDEKQAWKLKAKAAAEQHKKEHPNYRYGPGEEHYKKKRWVVCETGTRLVTVFL